MYKVRTYNAIAAAGLDRFTADKYAVAAETTDPDAILSRAEAAVRDGRLTDALAEIDTMPEQARAALDEWAGKARQRLEIQAAVQRLADWRISLAAPRGPHACCQPR